MIIKSFKSFIDRGKIIYTCHKLGIKKFKVRQDGKVDVDGRVLLYESGLKEIPVKFGNVSGDFNCHSNYAIQDKTVIWDRLIEVFYDFEIDPPKPPNFENYKIIF